MALAAVLAGPTAALAQRPPPKPIQLQALAPNVYWATDFSNVGVIVGDKGVVVFDAGGSAARAKELLAEIAKVTSKPVDTVIVSHSDGDHVDGLAGFPAGVRIIAQANTQKALKAEAAEGKFPADRVPNRPVADKESLTLDGVKMQLLHLGPAHTDGDLVVYLPDQKVVFAGDIFCMDQARAFVKPEQGGSSEGWIRFARGLLALNADRIVVGHGGVDGKAELKAFIDTSAAERDQVKAGLAKGQSLQQIEAEAREPLPAPPGPPNFKPFAQVVYEELTAHR
jgi:glyoxylase-like metal-dependent hydrolase (beta-lactamase superfamily II)